MAEYATRADGLMLRTLMERETCTLTHFLADTETGEAVVIDPVDVMADRDTLLLQELGFKLVYALNTHVHADHITGTAQLKKRNAGCQSVIAEVSGARADVKVKHGDEIAFGKFKLQVRSTPGHTDGCVTYVLTDETMAFTGDALLVRGCGRTDFQQGDSRKLYQGVWREVLSLPDSCALYPGHDYKGRFMTTVGEEKKYNLRLTKSEDEFVEIMANLGLAPPKYLDVALPANMVCGYHEEGPVEAEAE